MKQSHRWNNLDPSLTLTFLFPLFLPMKNSIPAFVAPCCHYYSSLLHSLHALVLVRLYQESFHLRQAMVEWPWWFCTGARSFSWQKIHWGLYLIVGLECSTALTNTETVASDCLYSLSLWFETMPKTLKRCCRNVLSFYDLKVGDNPCLLVMVYLRLYC